jgi:hypothetical protein
MTKELPKGVGSKEASDVATLAVVLVDGTRLVALHGGSPNTTHYMVIASSIVRPANLLPGAMQKSAEWPGWWQILQKGCW